jgi:pimeloyl-ACP methyl ester carboxylesterase
MTGNSMHRKIIAIAIMMACNLTISTCAAPAPKIAGSGSELVIPTAKHAKVKATYYPASSPKALILLFHQAGSNRNEYNSIVPRLLTSGYSALTVDQRGGGLLGSMIDGKPDMEAALDWAQDKGMPVIIWGSSYSASIVYVLAAEQPTKIKAALVFSGGDYLGGTIVTKAARMVSIPIFATSARDEVAEMKAVFDLVPGKQKQFFIPTLGGVHGSGTLSPKENPKGAEQNWTAVMGFLESVTASR